MKIKTTAEHILYYLKLHKGWVASGKLERNLNTLSKPSTIGRMLREMAEHGIILKDYKKIGSIRYVCYKQK